MANQSEKHQRNVPGAYYVDSSCCDCDLCRQVAPASFIRDDEFGLSYVLRQPQSPDEIALAEEARSGCPTESIGNDGTLAEDSTAGEFPSQSGGGRYH